MLMKIMKKRMFLMTTDIYIVISMFYYCDKCFININLFSHEKSIWNRFYLYLDYINEVTNNIFTEMVSNLPKVTQVKRDEATIFT